MLVANSMFNEIMDALDYAADDKKYESAYTEDEEYRREQIETANKWESISSALWRIDHEPDEKTEYTKLLIAEHLGHTIEIIEKETGECGVANSRGDMVAVFYGSEDGSDDCAISPEEFSRRFQITNIICGQGE